MKTLFKRSWALAILALAVVIAPTVNAAPAAPTYKPSVTVTSASLSPNGRTVYWSIRTSLNVVRGQGRRGTCRTFVVTVRVTPQGRRSITQAVQRVRVNGCFRGRAWSYRGWQDLAYIDITPGASHVYFSAGGVTQRWLARVP